MIRMPIGLAASILASTLVFPANAQETVTFATSTGSLSYVTYYTAREMGYFAEVGIEPEMILAGSAGKAVVALASGDVDVIMPAPMHILKAREEGLDLVLFGAVSTQLNTNIVFSKDWASAHDITEESSIEDKSAALEGMRLAINGPGSVTDSLPRYFAARAGLDPDRDLTLVAVPNQSTAMLLAMEQGRVDGFVIAPPDTTIAARELGAVVAFNVAAGKVPDLEDFFHIGLAATEAFIQTETAEKVARAFQMTLDAINDPNTTEVVRDKVHAAQYSNVDPVVFAEVWEDVIVAIPDTLRMDDGLFEKVIMLERIVAPDIDASMIAGSYTNELTERVAD